MVSTEWFEIGRRQRVCHASNPDIRSTRDM
jgi:hypothetical protein